MEAILQGTCRNSQILVRFGLGETLPSGLPAQDWLKGLPGRVFDRSSKLWTITGLGANPQAVLGRAGVTLDYGHIGPDSDLYGRTLAELVDPICQLKKGGRRVLVRPRLLGYDLALERLGQGATWDKASSRFELPVTDVLLGGLPRPRGHVEERPTRARRAVRHLVLSSRAAPPRAGLLCVSAGHPKVRATPPATTAITAAAITATKRRTRLVVRDAPEA